MSLETDSEKVILIAESERNFTAIKLPPTRSGSKDVIKLSRFSKYLAFPYKIEETENGLKIYHCRQFKIPRKKPIPYVIPNMENTVTKPRCLMMFVDGKLVEMESSLKTYDERNLSREGTLDRVIKIFRYCRLADDNKPPTIYLKYE